MLYAVSLVAQAENGTAPGFVLALACVIVLSSVGLAALIGLTRRIQQIGDQGSGDRYQDDRSDDD